mgnify:CR=1 FL=1
MSYNNLNDIKQAIMKDPDNITYRNQGWEPLFSGNSKSKIMIVGQAPGIKAQLSGLTWNDQSGDRLRSWLGVDKETFYNPNLFAMIPMDFYYPGKGKSGDLPPRKSFAPKWHKEIIKQLPNLKLIILVGTYATNFYLSDHQKKTLTETVRSFESYLPKYIPLVHPSPRNISWHVHNPWFKSSVIPKLQLLVKSILLDS